MIYLWGLSSVYCVDFVFDNERGVGFREMN